MRSIRGRDVVDRPWIHCPGCGIRNRAAREFCVACLAVLPAPRGEKARKAPKPARELRVAVRRAAPSALVLVLCGAAAVQPWRSVGEAPSATTPSIMRSDDVASVQRTAARVQHPDEIAEARILLTRGDHDGAIRVLTGAMGTVTDRAEYSATLGRALWAAGRRSEAADRLLEAVHRDVGALHPGYLLDAARALESVGRETAALELYERLLVRNPKDAEALKLGAAVHIRSGNGAAALPYLNRLLEVNASDAVARAWRADVLRGAGRLGEARADLELVVAARADAGVSRAQLAEVLHLDGNSPEAILVLQAGLAAHGSPLLLRQLASIQEQRGLRAEAVAAYREYLVRQPGAPDAAAIAERIQALE
jgi:tetratricopeptide (TPR) repeat protein